MKQKENQNSEKIKEIDQDNAGTIEVLGRDYPKYDYNYKIILIGNSGVGKKCLSLRAFNDKFQDNQSPTLGFDYNNLYLKYKNMVIKLEVWVWSRTISFFNKIFFL